MFFLMKKRTVVELELLLAPVHPPISTFFGFGAGLLSGKPGAGLAAWPLGGCFGLP